MNRRLRSLRSEMAMDIAPPATSWSARAPSRRPLEHLRLSDVPSTLALRQVTIMIQSSPDEGFVDYSRLDKQALVRTLKYITRLVELLCGSSIKTTRTWRLGWSAREPHTRRENWRVLLSNSLDWR